MTEDEWNSCTDPQAMLQFLRKSGRASDRKLRLYAVAYCRQVWFALKESNRRRAVAVAERYADGYAGPKLREARRSLKKQSPFRLLLGPDAWLAATEAPSSVAAEAVNALVYPKRWLSDGSAEIESWESAMWQTEMQRQQLVQASLLRDIFSLKAIQMYSEWLHWNNRIAVVLARDIYRERASYRAPVLAGVLEAAGCTDAELLGHLRAGGTHVRGCFALDAILGKG